MRRSFSEAGGLSLSSHDAVKAGSAFAYIVRSDPSATFIRPSCTHARTYRQDLRTCMRERERERKTKKKTIEAREEERRPFKALSPKNKYLLRHGHVLDAGPCWQEPGYLS